MAALTQASKKGFDRTADMTKKGVVCDTVSSASAAVGTSIVVLALRVDWIWDRY